MYFSHLLPDEEMREIIRKTGMGVESIEFSVGENLDRFSATMKNYQKRLEYMECESLLLHGPFLDLNPMAYDSGIRRVTMYRYEQAYEAAQILGAEKIVFHSCFLPNVYLTIGWADRVAEFYMEFLKDKDDSIEVLMENVLDPDPVPLKDVAEKISHKAFGLCLDLGHAKCYSKSGLFHWMETLEPYIRHVHLHDNMGERDSHLSLGDGNLPLKEISEFLKKNGNKKTYTIECAEKEAVEKSWDYCQNTHTFDFV